MLQDTSGRLFLALFPMGAPVNDAFDDKLVEPTSMDSVNANSCSSVVSNLEGDDFIYGTSGNDSTDTSFTDAERTQMHDCGGDGMVVADAGEGSIYS